MIFFNSIDIPSAVHMVPHKWSHKLKSVGEEPSGVSRVQFPSRISVSGLTTE
jgi:hypothetical protein